MLAVARLGMILSFLILGACTIERVILYETVQAPQCKETPNASSP